MASAHGIVPRSGIDKGSSVAREIVCVPPTACDPGGLPLAAGFRAHSCKCNRQVPMRNVAPQVRPVAHDNSNEIADAEAKVLELLTDHLNGFVRTCSKRTATLRWSATAIVL